MVGCLSITLDTIWIFIFTLVTCDLISVNEIITNAQNV